MKTLRNDLCPGFTGLDWTNVGNTISLGFVRPLNPGAWRLANEPSPVPASRAPPHWPSARCHCSQCPSAGALVSGCVWHVRCDGWRVSTRVDGGEANGALGLLDIGQNMVCTPRGAITWRHRGAFFASHGLSVVGPFSQVKQVYI